MNIKVSIYLILFCISFLLYNRTIAQSTYQFGALPSINLNKKLKNDWSLNFKMELRQLIQQGDFKGNVDRDFEYVLSDYSIIAAKKVGLNSRVAGGYLIRFRDKEVIHRIIQQYTIVQKMTSFRLAHRFAADQSFLLNESPEFRFRYRLTSEIPLNGQSVDPKEFYIKISNEFLNIFQNSEYNLEIRIVPLLGYDITVNNKIEIGLDYRVNSFLNNNARNSFWISLNWFIEI